MTLQGKGFFTDNLSECEGGDPAAILSVAQKAGLSHVVIKIAERNQPCNIDSGGIDTASLVSKALHQAGIPVWGWHHVSGDDPVAEAKIALERLHALRMEGYVINAEAEYEQPGREAAARLFMSTLCQEIRIPIALNSYRFPNFHPGFPWSAFLEGCDIHMPKVFWEQAHNAGEQLRESKRQCDALPNARPYIPTGATFVTSVWVPTPAEVTDFFESTHALGLPAVIFYSWEKCRKYLPEIWTVVEGFSWPVPPPENPPVASTSPDTNKATADFFSIEFLASLNSRNAARMASLYNVEAICTWDNESLNGRSAIENGYMTFFNSISPGIFFSLAESQVNEENHLLRWEAGPLTGETNFILEDGKIIRDITHITEAVG
jgi:hypothetical protein